MYAQTVNVLLNLKKWSGKTSQMSGRVTATEDFNPLFCYTLTQFSYSPRHQLPNINWEYPSKHKYVYYSQYLQLQTHDSGLVPHVTAWIL